jgi:hypothetical protein
MSKEYDQYATKEDLYEYGADLYESLMGHHNELEKRVLVLEEVLKGMQLPDHLTIAGMTYKRQPPEVK